MTSRPDDATGGRLATTTERPGARVDRPPAPTPAPALRASLAGYLAPKERLPRRLAVLLGLLGLALFLGLWSMLSYGGFVSDYFLPSPTVVLGEWVQLFREDGFLADIWASSRRILLGFAASAVLAVPLGILMGSFGFFQALLEPLIGAVRYMPASAFIPLLIIWLGIGDAQKVGVIFIGVFFPLTLLVADVSAAVPKELVNIAYTLGASRAQVFWRVLVPASLPGVIDVLRITMGWAWTYLIVAELVGANDGLGQLIMQSQRFLATDRIIASILTIGLLGIATDVLFRLLYARLFPYVERLQG